MHQDVRFQQILDAMGYGIEPNDPPRPQGPELRLMVATLEHAVFEYQKYAHVAHRRAQRLHREAKAWLWSNDESWLFSAARICEALKIDLDYLRRGLLAKVAKTDFVAPKQKPRLQLVNYDNYQVRDFTTEREMGRVADRARANERRKAA